MGEDSPAEEVGSVAEEATRLFDALRDWARDPADGPGAHASAGASAYQQAAAGATAWLHEVGEHVATGSEECRWCPVCRVVSVVKATPPDVRAHLGAAVGSLVQAAAGLLDTPVPDRTGRDRTRDDRPAGDEDAGPDVTTGSGGEHADPGSATWEDD